ncbi:hypothetical protein CAPTEDRAFT_228426 [Capitella teleta]|uniref:CAP-Gly domain-containing protein n=1 Tax=Capitella teleta TaxID=283909 RepID=R7TYX7_CAPTE|nr:hypothetical protein CAPTEDRAFT_228426 [Capitella teleta]|eukprot:ELT99138.1 hypothetical protein CAPTEDRAFT_228426 [Capitella teleta]
MMFSVWARADRLRTSPPGTPPSAPPGLRGSNRPCSPRPVVTQHNKGYTAPASTTGEALNLAGRHPFSPRTPADLSHGDVVKFSRQGGKISKGVIKYIGHLPSKNDTYLGVELEHEIGKHDGVYDGQRYFQSKHNRGVFVAFSKVVMAWHGSEEETL